MMHDKLRFMLFQVRNPDDAMREQEIDCFARAIGCDRNQIHVLAFCKVYRPARNWTKSTWCSWEAVAIILLPLGEAGYLRHWKRCVSYTIGRSQPLHRVGVSKPWHWRWEAKWLPI